MPHDVARDTADSFAFHIDPARRLNEVTMVGRVTAAKLMQTLSALQQHPDFDPAFDTLADYTGMSALDLTVEDLAEMARAHEIGDSRTGRTAMVVGNTLRYKTYAELFETLTQANADHRYRAFATRIEAEIWLGLRTLPARSAS